MSRLIDGKYEVLAKIKEGGMGAITKVRHVLLDEIRVVKTMRPHVEDDPEAKRRFLKEAKLATSLKHPHIATLLDFVEDRDTFYMVMEYIDGASLSEIILLNGPLSVLPGLDVGIQILDALSYLHRRGIIHRDISPENIMLTAGPEGEVVSKLIDLGIAKEASAPTMTMTGVFMGKLKYASPEQLGALKPGQKLDARSDLYSLGCVLYRTLTGSYAYKEAETPQGWMLRHLREAPRDFDETDPHGRIPEDVRAILLKAMSKDPDERWPTAEEFRRALLSARAAYLERTEVEDLGSGLVGAASGALGRAFDAEERTAFTLQLSLVKEKVAEEQRRIEQEEGNDFDDAASRVRREMPRPVPASPLPPLSVSPSRGRWKIPALLGASAAIVVLAVFFLRGSQKGADRIPAVVKIQRPVPVGAPASGAVRLTAAPWGEVLSVYDEKANRLIDIGPIFTPARIDLPPGLYTIRVRGETGRGQMEAEKHVEVVARVETALHIPLKGFEPDEVIRSLIP